jgi:hypothetical protein
MSLDDWHKPIDARFWPLLGVVLLCGAVVSTFTGRTWLPRTSYLTHRQKDPVSFWGMVATYYLVGIYLIIGFILW